jgi:hypothetical protein
MLVQTKSTFSTPSHVGAVERPAYLPDSRLPEGIEPIHAFLTATKRGTILAEILCPFCGDRHVHGAGTPERPVFGPRQAHCLTGRPRDYWILGGGLDYRPPALSSRERTRRLIEDDVASGIRSSLRRPDRGLSKNRSMESESVNTLRPWR